jgi:hypothetical protein
MARPCQLEMKRTARSVTAPPEDRSRLRIDWSRLKGQMEPGQNCAYNQTRECFLGLQVIAGDFSLPSLNEWVNTLTPNSGSGIWMVPFRGVLATQVRAPLDLLYLDEDCRVIDAVEFFPTFCVSPSSPPASSVLALPSHSIFSSQTQPGDRLMVCSAEEMEWLLEQAEQPGTTNVSTPPSVSSSSQGPVLVRELPRKAGSPAVQGEEIQKASGPAVLREMPKRVDAPAVLEPPRFPVQLEPPEPPPTQSQPLAQPASSSVAEPAGKPKARLAGALAVPRSGGPEEEGSTPTGRRPHRSLFHRRRSAGA